MLKISNREITKEELQLIYDDFKKIEIDDGIPDSKEERFNVVAEKNNIVIGFASGLRKHKWFYLTDLWISELHRREGLGTRLLKMLEENIKAIGIKHIYTWTSGLINPLFYEKQGYYKFTIFENFYEIEGYHQIGYRKDF